MAGKWAQDFFTGPHLFSVVNAGNAACLLITIILSVSDAWLTLALTAMGAWEANPVMRSAIAAGPAFFIFIKTLLTSAGMLFLILLGDKRVFRGILSTEQIAAGLVLFYQGLVLYELNLYHILT
ncbi:hypothetical protein JW906_03320 [bacterium]|nr:hypothetical protein [bacterium]